MADIKAIEFAIKGNDLASKPLAEIGAAIAKLTASLAEIVPASEKGEKNLAELKEAAAGLKEALKALSADQNVINRFQALSVEIAETTAKLEAQRSGAEAAKAGLETTGLSAAKLATAQGRVDKAIKSTETALAGQVARLEKLKGSTAGAAIDFDNLAASQEHLDKAFLAAGAATVTADAALAAYGANQKKAAAAAQLAADAQAVLVAAEKEQAAAAAKVAQEAEVAAKATQRAAQEKIAAEATATAAFKREVLEAEKARTKDVALAFAEEEVARAAHIKATALETAAKAAADEAAATAKAATAVAYWTDLERRFTEVLKGSAGVTEQSSRAAKEHAGATEHAAAAHEKMRHSFSLFRDEGRTTLSLYQRMRGEILSMTAEFVGFYGIIEMVKAGFEDIQKFEGATSILESTFGSKDAAKEQLEYVATQVKRLKLADAELAMFYAKFEAAAKGTGISLEESRAIFETFAEAARVKNLSGDSMNTIFSALGKIMAKDTVGAGELFKKLSTDLPDAAAIFAASMNTPDGIPLTIKQFEELLKTGDISSTQLVGFAKKLRESFAGQLPASLKTTTATLQDFKNAVNDLEVNVLKSGALDAFTEGLDKISGYLRSTEGEEFTKKLGAGLKLVADGFVYVTTHLEQFGKVLAAIGVLWAANLGVSAYKDLMYLAQGFTWLTAKAALYNATVQAGFVKAGLLTKLVSGAVGVLGAWFAGFTFGGWLYENVAGVRVAATAIIGSFDVMFETIKGNAHLMWTSMWHPDNFDAEQKAFDAAQIKRIADFKEQMRSAGRDESGAALPPPGTEAAAPASTERRATPEEAALAAAKKLASDLKIQTDAMEKASKSVTDRVAEMRSALVKKGADDINTYMQGVTAQLRPLADEIDKLADPEKGALAHYPGKVKELRAQLVALKAEARASQIDVFSEKNAKAGKQAIDDAVRLRDIQIHIEELKKEGGQSAQLTQANVAAISAKANVQIAERIIALQKTIATLPDHVKLQLEQTSAELGEMQASLVNRAKVNNVKEMTEPAEELLRLLDMRKAKLESIKQLEAVGVYTQGQAIEKQKAISAEYEPTIKAALAYVEVLRLGKNLTADEIKQLDVIADKLEIAGRTAKKVPEGIYTAGEAARDLSGGMTKVGAAFAKAVGQGHGLKGAFQAAGAAFKQFASDFLLKIGEMIFQAQMLKIIQASTGTGMNAGGAGGDSTAGILGMAISSMATASHSGGMAGFGVPRQIHEAYFHNAPRMHSGGMVGIDQNEVPAILQRGEEVLAKNDARNAMNGGKTSTPQHIQVVNAIDHESVVRQGLQAPSNTKVVLNMIRANRNSIKAALG